MPIWTRYSWTHRRKCSWKGVIVEGDLGTIYSIFLVLISLWYRFVASTLDQMNCDTLYLDGMIYFKLWSRSPKLEILLSNLSTWASGRFLTLRKGGDIFFSSKGRCTLKENSTVVARTSGSHCFLGLSCDWISETAKILYKCQTQEEKYIPESPLDPFPIANQPIPF